MRGGAVAALVAASMAVPAVAAAAAAPRAVPVRSSYETTTRAVSRDVGISVALPDGHALWIFGDTGIYRRTGSGGWKEAGFIDGSTALQGRYSRGSVPHGRDYPSGVPSRFIPVPKNVYLPDGSGRPCNYQTAAFPARWPTGAAVMASNPSQVLVTYSEVCISQPVDGWAIRAEGWGYMLYNWRTQRIDRGPIDVFKPKPSGAELPPGLNFRSPQFVDGKLTLFAARCTSFYVACYRGRVWSVTMPGTTRAMDNPASYKKQEMLTDSSGKWEPLTFSVGRDSSGWRLIQMTSIGGTYKVFSAPKLGARWHLDQSGTLPGCVTPTLFCFALEGHPELNTKNRLFVSYFSPVSGPHGHIVVSAIPAHS